jgi:hypothetical protein
MNTGVGKLNKSLRLNTTDAEGNPYRLTDKEINDYIENDREAQKIKNQLYKLENPHIFVKPDESQRKDFTKGMSKQDLEEIINTHLAGRSPDIDLNLDPQTGNSCVILGSSKRGKSYLMMHLYDKYYSTSSGLYKEEWSQIKESKEYKEKPVKLQRITKKKFYCDREYIAVLFSISNIPMYQRDNLIKCNGFNKEAEKLIKLEKVINTRNKEMNKYKFINLFDDIIDHKHSKLLENLILTYRNSNISSIICLQYGYLLSKSARANVNNIILFGFNSDESIEVIIKTYLGSHLSRMGIKHLPFQLEFYKAMTADHGFIYIQPVRDQITFHRLVAVKG